MRYKAGVRHGSPHAWLRRVNVGDGNYKASLIIGGADQLSDVMTPSGVIQKVVTRRVAKAWVLPQFLPDLDGPVGVEPAGDPQGLLTFAAQNPPAYEVETRPTGAPHRPVAEALFGDADEIGQFTHQDLPQWLTEVFHV